jgi:hypothetical protein
LLLKNSKKTPFLNKNMIKIVKKKKIKKKKIKKKKQIKCLWLERFWWGL